MHARRRVGGSLAHLRYRADGTPITLPDGTARLIGKLVQRYDPDTGAWTPGGSLLGNGGVVKLCIEWKGAGNWPVTAEVYDPLTGVSQLSRGNARSPEGGHQATVLSLGRGDRKQQERTRMVSWSARRLVRSCKGHMEPHRGAEQFSRWARRSSPPIRQSARRRRGRPKRRARVFGRDLRSFRRNLDFPRPAWRSPAGTISAVSLLDGRVLVAGAAPGRSAVNSMIPLRTHGRPA